MPLKGSRPTAAGMSRAVAIANIDTIGAMRSIRGPTT